MKITPVRNIYTLPPSFTGRTKREETKKQYAAIKEAIEIIANDPSYPPRIKSISKITGIPTSIITVRIHTQGNDSYEISKLWQDITEKRQNTNGKSKVSNKSNSEILKKDKDEKNYKAIKEAMEQIAQNPALKPTKATIAGLTGLSDGQIHYYFNYENAGDESLAKLWKKVLKQRKASDSHVLSVAPKAPSEEEFKKIKEAVNIIEKNPIYPPTTASISKITGISEYLICRYINHPSTYELFEKLEENTVIKRTNMVLADKKLQKKLEPPKIKDLKRAVKIIQYALTTGTKLSYKELETACGLSKDEVDQLIKQYANFRQKQSEQQRMVKAQQAKWYKDNVVNKDTSILFYTGTEYSDTTIKQAGKIKEAMMQLKNEGVRITYSEISRYTGIEYTAVKFRINDPNFPELKEIFDNSQ